MRKRLTLLIATLAVAAVAVPSAASAATLYTTAAHTTAVPVGTTITAAIPSGTEHRIYSGTSLVNVCFGGTLSLKVTQNSAGTFKADVTGDTFAPGCLGTLGSLQGKAGGTLQVSGSSVVNGSNSAWLGTALTGVLWEFPTPKLVMKGNFTSAAGSPPKNGVFSQQPTAAKAPVSVELTTAKTLESCPYAECNVSATYTLTGTAAAYSLG
jgi:hypothetical protein